MTALRIAAAAMAFALAGPMAANAQDSGEEAAPAAADGAEAGGLTAYGDWRLRCVDPANPAGCDIVQTISHRESGAMLMSFSIAYSADQDIHVTQILVPLGVNLRRGVDIAVGDVAPRGIPVTRCEPTGCVIEATLAADMLAAMRAAENGRLTVYADDGSGASIEFSLDGFTGALAALDEEAGR